MVAPVGGDAPELGEHEMGAVVAAAEMLHRLDEAGLRCLRGAEQEVEATELTEGGPEGPRLTERSELRHRPLTSFDRIAGVDLVAERSEEATNRHHCHVGDGPGPPIVGWDVRVGFGEQANRQVEIVARRLGERGGDAGQRRLGMPVLVEHGHRLHRALGDIGSGVRGRRHCETEHEVRPGERPPRRDRRWRGSCPSVRAPAVGSRVRNHQLTGKAISAASSRSPDSSSHPIAACRWSASASDRGECRAPGLVPPGVGLDHQVGDPAGMGSAGLGGGVALDETGRCELADRLEHPEAAALGLDGQEGRTVQLVECFERVDRGEATPAEDPFDAVEPEAAGHDRQPLEHVARVVGQLVDAP